MEKQWEIIERITAIDIFQNNIYNLFYEKGLSANFILQLILYLN